MVASPPGRRRCPSGRRASRLGPGHMPHFSQPESAVLFLSLSAPLFSKILYVCSIALHPSWPPRIRLKMARLLCSPLLREQKLNYQLSCPRLMRKTAWLLTTVGFLSSSDIARIDIVQCTDLDAAGPPSTCYQCSEGKAP
jgi:hypothetical protein